MPEPQRRDAVANRARIVETARAMMAASDELRLSAVATRAGVGQATFYRHFPTREALLSEVYRSDVDDLVAAASTLLEQHEPLEALGRWFERVADYAKVKRDFFAALEVGDAITLLLEAGKRAGSLRPDVDARDVMLLIGYLSRIDQTGADQRGRHLLTIVLDGLRFRR